MPPLSLGLKGSLHSRPRVDDLRFTDDQAILDQLADILTRVGIGYLGGLVWVEPNLTLTTLED